MLQPENIGRLILLLPIVTPQHAALRLAFSCDVITAVTVAMFFVPRIHHMSSRWTRMLAFTRTGCLPGLVILVGVYISVGKRHAPLA